MSAPDRSDRDTWWAAAVIAAAIVFAVVVSVARARAGSADLWYDDSWVGFAARVPLAKAVHLGVTAPGYTVVIRWWMGLRRSLSWAQSFALVGFVLCPFAVFGAARAAGAARWAAATAAVLTALNPMLLVESAHVKQYTWEFALSAVMVGLAAAVRRDGPTTRLTVAAGVVVVVATFFSASMLISGGLLFLVLAVGLWSAVRRVEDPLPARDAVARLAILLGAGVIVLISAALLLLHSPPLLAASYRSLDGFLGSSHSVRATVRQSVELVRGFMGGFFFGGTTVLLVIPLALLVWFAVQRGRTVWWLLAAPAVAVVLSAAQRYPLAAIGYSRVEAWLMPWVAVLLALALAEIAAVAQVDDVIARVPIGARVGVAVVLAVGLSVAAWRQTLPYPTTRARAAVATLTAVSAHGTAYVLYQDDPVEVVAPGPLHIVNDKGSLQGFSVASMGGGLRVLHLYPADVALRELQSPCGHTIAVAGADLRALGAVFDQLGCRILQQHFDDQGTIRTDDDTDVVTFGPAPG